MTDASTKSLVQSQFGANAANYLTSTVHAKGGSLARLVELVAPAADWQALDIATGAGHTAAAFAPHVARVVASDLTPEMLVQAAKLAASKGIANMETAIADAEHLPFADASFDLVTCRIAPHHFPDVAAYVRESARVLKSGGTFALVDNVSPDDDTTPGFTVAELHEAGVTYNAFEKLRDPSHGRALATAEWLALLGQAGLRLLHKEHAPKAMEFAEWCRNMAVPTDKAAALEAMLRNATPAFKAFIDPAERDGRLGFRLYEAIIIARKAA